MIEKIFNFFSTFRFKFIVRNVLFSINVLIILILCFLLVVMITIYRSEDGAFRRPHNLWANRTDNRLLHKGIQYSVISFAISCIIIHFV